MLKAFLLPYWFTSFSTPRFRGHAMGVFASAQANLTDSYQHLSNGRGSAEGAPGYKAGYVSGSPSASGDSLNSGKLLFVFSLLLGLVPLLLIPKVKMNCNNTIQSALKTVECLVTAIGWNCQISQGNQSPQVCLGP